MGKTTKLKDDQFIVWLTLPRSMQADLREAAGSLNMPMSEFARAVVREAVGRFKAGRPPLRSKRA